MNINRFSLVKRRIELRIFFWGGGTGGWVGLVFTYRARVCGFSHPSCKMEQLLTHLHIDILFSSVVLIDMKL